MSKTGAPAVDREAKTGSCSGPATPPANTSPSSSAWRPTRPLLTARIPDWRAMVDVVLIDTDYDGEVFNIVLSDVPEKKDDLVAGCYELPAPEGPARVAVEIVDMLGEEVIKTADV